MSHLSGPGRFRSAALQIIAVCGSALAALVATVPVPALPALAMALGMAPDNPLAAQLVLVAPAISFALAAPLTGWLATRVDARRGLAGALLLFVASGLAPLCLDSLVPLLLSRLLLGAAGGVISTYTTAMAGDFAPLMRDRVLGFSHAAGGLGAFACLTVGGWLVDQGGWRAPFLLYAAGLPILVLALLAVAPERAAINAINAIARRRLPAGLWPVYVLLFCMSVGFFAPGTEGAFLLRDRAIDSAAAQGVLLSLMPLASVLVSLAYGPLARWLSQPVLVFITLVATGGGLIVAGASSSVVVIGGGLALTGVGAGLAVPVVAALLLARTDPAVRSWAIGLYFTVMFAAQFLTPLLLDGARTLLGHGSAGALVLLGAVIVAFGLLPAGRDRTVEKETNA